MKNTKRNNLTYSGVKTKYQKERRQTLTILSGIFALVMLLALYSCISDYILSNKIKEIKTITNISNNIDIKDLSIYTISNDNEKTAYLAIFQAVDLLLANQSKEVKNQAINDLHAIAYTENHNYSYNTPGQDSYQSSGLFQISLFYHPSLTLNQINDPYFAANWTLARLLANNYLSDRNNSIRRHNGSITNYKTALYLAKVNNHINLIK